MTKQMAKKVLIIEDELALQKTLSEVLAQEGYLIVTASDGEEGLKSAQSENPDLILLDLVLPKIHGFDVLKKLKENSVTESIPVIILTNLESTEDVEKAVELGATTYLVKADYNLEDVLGKVKGIIGN
jgi:DNA-binding response OmpR family regulator